MKVLLSDQIQLVSGGTDSTPTFQQGEQAGEEAGKIVGKIIIAASIIAAFGVFG